MCQPEPNDMCEVARELRNLVIRLELMNQQHELDIARPGEDLGEAQAEIRLMERSLAETERELRAVERDLRWEQENKG